MKFGKEFRTHLEETLPEWKDKYLCYKPLKKLLKHIPTSADSEPLLPDADGRPVDHAVDSDHDRVPMPLAGLQDWFVKILSEELDKFNDFYVDKEEDFIIRFQVKFKALISGKQIPSLKRWPGFSVEGSRWRRKEGHVELSLMVSLLLMELKERIELVKEKSCKDGVFTSECEFSEEMMNIRKDFVTIHGEMVLLKNYSSLNFAGLIKILKKYDKRTGGLLRLPFTQLALGQPFFTTEALTRLVRDCEANLEVLFPLEAEVVESTSTAGGDEENPLPTQKTKVSPETSSSPGEETADVYRSTLAAIRTIQGLKKASSTYNSLSLSSIFGRQDNDSTGAVTAENSDTDSLTSSQKGE
ncbi:hypothetical protein RJ640_025659 [Escallonia rubra]|uniref:SPX domain-containing protein n=1 Tax=Escallonia rubra TaxID=112253 RepID=A0AA88UQQ3_9ASTE|nr:hypothetical protein RJ640_025659 [Escallonia rubra]